MDCDVVVEQSRFSALVNSFENLASMAISQRMVECEHHSAHGDKGLLLGLMRVEITSSETILSPGNYRVGIRRMAVGTNIPVGRVSMMEPPARR